jgi:hypothetical protein
MICTSPPDQDLRAAVRRAKVKCAEGGGCIIETLQKNTVTRQLHATTSSHESSLTTKIRGDNNSTID